MEKSKEKQKLILIDGDNILYRSAFACASMSDFEDVKDYIWKMMLEVTNNLDTYNYIGFLQGKGNFRHEVSKTAVYKGKRPSEKPFWFYVIKKHLIESYNFIEVNGMESDDALTVLQHRLRNTHDTVIASIDKDLLQCPGRHYNLNTQEENFSSTRIGLKLLATQIITGDTTDNIPGLHRVGPKKAEKILSKAKEDLDYLPLSLQAYIDYYFEKQEKDLKKKEEGVEDITTEEIFLKAVEHYTETFKLVFLLRNLSEDVFPTPNVSNLLKLEKNPLEYGTRKSEEDTGTTLFD